MSEDEKIIQLFFERKEQAISLLSEKYEAACLYTAKNILKNEDDALECINDAYLALWNTVPPEKPKPLKTYLLKIVRNIAVKRYHANTAVKRNSFYDTALDELEDCLACLATPEQELTAKELSEQINAFLGTLSKENRVMFVRRYWQGVSVGDLSRLFSISENSVSARLSRIRVKLKKFLRKEGYEI